MTLTSDQLNTLNAANIRLAQDNAALRDRLSAPEALKSNGGGGTSGGMDITEYRLNQFEKRAEQSDARMGRIEEKLTDIQIALAGLATRDTIRNWGIAVVGVVIATGIAMGAIMLQSTGNQLSAFQAGLSAIQAVGAASQMSPPSATNPKP